MVNIFDQNAHSTKLLSNSNLNDKELFLTNNLKIIFSLQIVSYIPNWLDNKFIPVYRADAVTPSFSDLKKNSIFIEKTINEAVTCFGISSNALGYITKDEGSDATLCSVFKNAKMRTLIPAELFESYGMVHFMNMFPIWPD